jgi:hypothetical protein
MNPQGIFAHAVCPLELSCVHSKENVKRRTQAPKKKTDRIADPRIHNLKIKKEDPDELSFLLLFLH